MEILRTFFLAVGWIVLTFFAAAFLVPNRSNPNLESVFLLASVSLGLIYPVIAIHELGHLLAARASKFRILAAAVGPLIVDFRKAQPRFTFDLRSKRRQAGHVRAVPTDDVSLKSRFLLFIAGGPIAHVLMVFCALMATLWATDAVSLSVAYAARAALIASASLFVFELVPMKNNDFSKILAVLFSGKISRAMAIATLGGQSMSGIRPRAWSQALLSSLGSPSDKSAECALGHLFGYYHAIDSHALQTAREHVANGQACEIKDNKLLLGLITNEAAYLSALSGDFLSAQSSIQHVDGAPFQSSFLRTKAAIASAQGDSTQAEIFARAALQADTESIDGWIVAERDLLKVFLRATLTDVG